MSLSSCWWPRSEVDVQHSLNQDLADVHLDRQHLLLAVVLDELDLGVV